MMLYLGIAIGVIVTAAVFIGGPPAYWGVMRRPNVTPRQKTSLIDLLGLNRPKVPSLRRI
jgi:hypothetical protein